MQPINTRFVVMLNEGYTLHDPRWRQIFETGFRTLDEALLKLQRFDHNYKRYGSKGYAIEEIYKML